MPCIHVVNSARTKTFRAIHTYNSTYTPIFSIVIFNVQAEEFTTRPSIVLRLYEAYGSHATVTVNVNLPVKDYQRYNGVDV